LISIGDLAAYLQGVVAGAFVLLGIATTIGWLRQRDRSLGFLALAIILLSAVSLLGQIRQLLGLGAAFFGVAGALAFMASGYALFRFRAALVPMPRAWHLGVVALTVCGAALLSLATLAGTAAGPLGFLALAAAVTIWCGSVGEPVVRFWLVARRLPAVQQMRLKSLSLGFAGIVVLILVSVAAGRVVSTPTGRIATQLVALGIVGLLFVSFSPPAWLRRTWRTPEEEAARGSIDGVLLGSNHPKQLAEGVLRWATRLVGAEAAVLLDPDGNVLATRGLDPIAVNAAADLARGISLRLSRIEIKGEARIAMGVPIQMERGTGRLVVLAGRFSPVFGSDELNRLEQYAIAIGPALDRLNLIDQLQHANAQLAEASRHKSAFLANMSHELRTPLNAIIGFSELMIDDTNGEFPESTRRTFTDQIHSSGEHLLGLINDILDLSKIEAGQMELRSEPVLVESVVDRVVQTVVALAAKKRIQLSARATKAGTIEADPAKLTQMLLNLVSNAIKFTPDDGQITIAARRLRGSLEITVRDTGIGIAPADQERVFQQFEQVGNGDTRNQPGTGLGLTLTKRFAELHGGSLRLRSRLGHGSVFTVTLPLAPPSTQATPAPETLVPASSLDADAPLVLVVEDNPQATELLIRNLNRGGFRTEQARNGTEALAKARACKPAAITLDIMLPEVDGWTVLGQLKQEEATRGIPVVVVSVVDHPELGLALGAIDYLVKPVDAKQLLETLGRFSLVTGEKQELLHVLVVDDEVPNQTWIRNLLEPAGYRVSVAGGGEQALELLRMENPDVIVLDLMMPGMTGFELVEALRTKEGTRSVPILVLTAKDLTMAERRELNGRVAAVLSRKTGAADLLTVLDDLVRPDKVRVAS
jgi:signal transduction histidine kinase/CheY-like chemotaxis protein